MLLAHLVPSWMYRYCPRCPPLHPRSSHRHHCCCPQYFSGLRFVKHLPLWQPLWLLNNKKHLESKGPRSNCFISGPTVDGSEILHQLIGSSSHYSQGFIHPRWLFGISSTILSNGVYGSSTELGPPWPHPEELLSWPPPYLPLGARKPPKKEKRTSSKPIFVCNGLQGGAPTSYI